MIDCKKTIIATCFTLMLPLTTTWSEAIIVDDSENFAMMEEQAYEAPVARQSKYDDGFSTDDEAALVKEDTTSYNEPNAKFKNNANLIDKVQALQKEIQELRGQLEVQAHDLKLLQQQQVAFYKDLDARLGASSGKLAQNKPTPISTPPAPIPVSPSKVVITPPKLTKAAPVAPKPAVAVARGNPADEQISYLAAYELVKNKKFAEATNSMEIFVQKYPQGGYTANAQYWLGELYLLKKDYTQAIAHFEVVLNQFPSSSKAGDCMLKVGYAYAASGNTPEARQQFQKVVKNYPNTPTAQLAQSKLETINAL